LELVEDESDVLAAKELKAEVKADIAEFDENEIINNNGENPDIDKKSDELNKIEIEFKSIETEVKWSTIYFFEAFYFNLVLI
jgi:hypothetical protein